MLFRKKVVVSFLAAMLLLSISMLSGCAKSTDVVVAEVNGTKITRTELDKFLNVNRLFNPQLEQMVATKEGLAQIESYYLDEMIQFTLLEQWAAELGIEVSNEEKEAYFQNVKQQLVMSAGSEEALTTQLQDLKITDDDIRVPIYSSLYQDGILNYLAGQIADEEAAAFSSEKPLTGINLDVSHILVDSEEGALAARQRIFDGELFTEIAKELSSCPSSEQGGSLGQIPADTQNYDKDFMTGANALAVDEVSMPIKTQFGWHLILVSERSEPDQKAIKRTLAAQKLEEKFAEYKESAKITNSLIK